VCGFYRPTSSYLLHSTTPMAGTTGASSSFPRLAA
jgi:hypothetical protein